MSHLDPPGLRRLHPLRVTLRLGGDRVSATGPHDRRGRAVMQGIREPDARAAPAQTDRATGNIWRDGCHGGRTGLSPLEAGLAGRRPAGRWSGRDAEVVAAAQRVLAAVADHVPGGRRARTSVGIGVVVGRPSVVAAGRNGNQSVWEMENFLKSEVVDPGRWQERRGVAQMRCLHQHAEEPHSVDLQQARRQQPAMRCPGRPRAWPDPLVRIRKSVDAGESHLPEVRSRASRPSMLIGRDGDQERMR